jgi:hypothetical protein
MEQKPSIGRIVLYQRHGSPNGQHKSEPSPAVITAVHEGLAVSVVDLFVINPNGLYFNLGTVYDPDGGPGTWRWPPRA